MADSTLGVGLEVPVVQAGMGGGLATHELAAAVSEAGGLGTIGILPPQALRDEIAAARRLTGKPLAVNLIVPLAGRRHWEAAAEADVIVTHWEERPRRRTAKTWIHTIGSVAEAQLAVAAGADAVIAQGSESGGHVRGAAPSLELLATVRSTLPPGYPVIVAGGIADAADVRAALAAGAAAAVSGTRFLASDESRAHPAYKRRLVAERETVVTELFGMAWPHASHRILRNAATERWLAGDPRGPAAVRAVHGILAPLARRAPMALQLKLAGRARSGVLDLAPTAPLAGMPEAAVETHPLYAGTTVARIDSLLPAREIVRRLAP